MNYLLKTLFTLLLLQGGAHLYAQLGIDTCNHEIINNYQYTFDELEDFTATWGNGSENWQWVSDGTAAGLLGTFWGEGDNARSRIASPSGGGAVAIGGDVEGNLVISGLNFSINSPVYLCFNQYFRRYDSMEPDIRIIVRNSAGTETTFIVNQEVPINVETSYRDRQVIDITAAIGENSEGVSIRFEYSGEDYFWIIDDIGFYDDYPCLETTPAHYGPILTDLGYPYEVDDAGWPYVPGEMVIQFTDDANQMEIDAIADEYGILLNIDGFPMKETCVCDSLELWFLGDEFIDPVTGQSVSGQSIGILERTMGANSQNKVMGADPNYYTAAQIEALEAQLTPAFLTQSEKNYVNVNPYNPSDIRIAILDTGIDLMHPDLRDYIKAKPGNCYEFSQHPDVLGHNFVDNNNNPQDDHSHGTHVAGIIAKRLANAGELACGFHFIPYKTHDKHGISTLFDVTCATYQAITDEVSIINDSWGFYGTGSIVLNNAVKDAEEKNILIVSAAGNDSISLDNYQLYPACYTASNKLTVASYETDAEGTPAAKSDFSNHSNTWVDVAASGRNILSAIPAWYNNTTANPTPCFDGAQDCKTGTSMATPTVTAGAAIAYCERPGDPVYAKERILNCADFISALSEFVNGGLAFNSVLDASCLTPLNPEPLLEADELIHLFPNPAQDQVNISSLKNLTNGRLRLYDATGKLLSIQTFDSWLEGEQRQLRLEELPSGLYLIQLQTKEQLQTIKLIKS